MNITKERKNWNASVISGILAPIIFVFVFTIDGVFRENYSSLKNFISELSMGEGGGIQISNFLVFGFLSFIFSIGVYREFKKRNIPKTGPILLMIIAICYFFSGPFVTDPNTIFARQKSIHGIIHGILGAIVFTLMPISSWVFLKQFKKYADFKSFVLPTYTAALFITVAVLILTFITKIPTLNNIFSNWVGLIQRLALIPFMLWMCWFAYKLTRNVN